MILVLLKVNHMLPYLGYSLVSALRIINKDWGLLFGNFDNL